MAPIIAQLILLLSSISLLLPLVSSDGTALLNGDVLCRGFINRNPDPNGKKDWEVVEKSPCKENEYCAAQVKYDPGTKAEPKVNWFHNYCEDKEFLEKINASLDQGCFDYQKIVKHADANVYELGKTVGEPNQYLCYCREAVCNTREKITEQFKKYKSEHPEIFGSQPTVEPAVETSPTGGEVKPPPPEEETSTAGPPAEVPTESPTTLTPSANAAEVEHLETVATNASLAGVEETTTIGSGNGTENTTLVKAEGGGGQGGDEKLQAVGGDNETSTTLDSGVKGKGGAVQEEANTTIAGSASDDGKETTNKTGTGASVPSDGGQQPVVSGLNASVTVNQPPNPDPNQGGGQQVDDTNKNANADKGGGKDPAAKK